MTDVDCRDVVAATNEVSVSHRTMIQAWAVVAAVDFADVDGLVSAVWLATLGSFLNVTAAIVIIWKPPQFLFFPWRGSTEDVEAI